MNPFLGRLLERSFATTEGLRPRLPSLFEPASTDVLGSRPVLFGTVGPEWDKALDDSDRHEDTAGLRVTMSAQEVEIGQLGKKNHTLPSARIRAETSRSAPIPMPATGASRRVTSALLELSEPSPETQPLAIAPVLTPSVAIAALSPPVSPAPAPAVAISRKTAKNPAEPGKSTDESRPAAITPPVSLTLASALFGLPSSTRQVARPVGANPVELPSSAVSRAGPAERRHGASASESQLAGAGPTVLIERIARLDRDPQQPTPRIEWRERLIESPPLEGRSTIQPPVPTPPAAQPSAVPASLKPVDSVAAPGTPQVVVPQPIRLAPRPVSLPPIAPAASARPSAGPTIQVTIGRIEVRATSPSPATPKKAPPKPAAMSLEEYLKQRNEGRR